MKFCSIVVFAVAFLALAIADESHERKIPDILKKIHDDCEAQTEITPYALCKNHKLGFQNLNGDIDKDSFRASFQKFPHISADKVDKIVTECGERKGATAGEAANAVDHCVKKILYPEGHAHGHH